MALPLQNISFSFPCLTEDCITGRLRNAALPESPASSGKPQKTLAPADPPGVWTSKTGAGRSGRSFPGRKLSEPTLNWVLSRQCLYLLHYLFFSKDKSGSGSQRSSRGGPVYEHCHSSSFFFGLGNKSCRAGLCQWIVTRDSLGPSLLKAQCYPVGNHKMALSLHLRTEVNLLHIYADLRVDPSW